MNRMRITLPNLIGKAQTAIVISRASYVDHLILTRSWWYEWQERKDGTWLCSLSIPGVPFFTGNMLKETSAAFQTKWKIGSLNGKQTAFLM